MNRQQEQGFVLVFVIAMVAALSVMTASMNFYYDSALKSVSRNSVYQQIKLASESGLQAGKTWLLSELNKDQFSLLDIQNNSHVDNSDNLCLNRHGYTDTTKDVFFSKRIISGDLGTTNLEYEVFIQRYADVIKSIYFSGTGTSGTDFNRSGAYIRKFRDFPNNQFTVEAWFKNKRGDTDTYDQHLWEWGRLWDVVFKVRRNTASGNNHQFSPRIGGIELAATPGQSNGEPVRNEWTHIAWVWDGGNSSGNVRIYQNGILTGTWNAAITADVIPTNQDYDIGNDANELPEIDYFALAIGEGLDGYGSSNDGTANDAETLAADFQGVPWKGNIVEFRFWSNSRTQTNIDENFRTRLTGGEPNLISYFKFNEGTGSTAFDYNTTRPAARKNDLTIMGIGSQGTEWQEDIAKYTLVADHDSTPTLNVPPGEDVAYYRILSCGKGSDGQLVPMEGIYTAPVIQGGVGDGEIQINASEVTFTDQGVPPLRAEFSFYTDGSENSIYANGEDSLDINTLSGWTKTQSFTSNSSPLTLTPPVGNLTLTQLKNGIANVFYKNCSKEQDCSVSPQSYTPGTRRIKVDLIYSNVAFNQTIGIVKSLTARDKIVLTPVSWVKK